MYTEKRTTDKIFQIANAVHIKTTEKIHIFHVFYLNKSYKYGYTHLHQRVQKTIKF